MVAQDNRKNDDNTMNILDQQLKDISSKNQCLSFVIGNEEYAVEVLGVQEIIRYTPPTPIPNAPEVIAGVINFRGKIIPVIDLRKKFGLPEKNYDSFNIIIVIEIKEKTMGVIVDQVSDVLSFAEDEVQEPDEDLINEIKVHHIKGLGKLKDGRLIQILAPEKLLSLDELMVMQKVEKEKPQESENEENHE